MYKHIYTYTHIYIYAHDTCIHIHARKPCMHVHARTYTHAYTYHAEAALVQLVKAFDSWSSCYSLFARIQGSTANQALLRKDE